MRRRKMVYCFSIILFAAIILLSLFYRLEKSYSASSEVKFKWSYSGKTGPEYWGELNPSYIQCSKGSMQSPINIDTSEVVKISGLAEILFRYSPSSFTVKNNGRTIIVKPNNQKNLLLIGNTKYILQQIHFHHPSEHELNKQKFPIEIHLVHQNSIGEIAVVGLFVKEGMSNSGFKTIFAHIPRTINLEETVKEKLDLASLLLDEKEVYRYEGSLTTPPCTEDVKWLIFKKPIEMSKQQIRQMAQLYPVNNRPLQSIGNRDVYIKRKDFCKK